MKCWLFQEAAKAERSPETFPSWTVMVGGVVLAPVWGSFWLVATAKRTAKNGVPLAIDSVAPLPPASKGWAVSGW